MMSTRIDSMMGALSETQQRPIRRHRGYQQKHGWNIFTIPLDDLRKMKRDCGTERSAAILDCTEAQINERLAPGSEMRRAKAEGKALAKIAEAQKPAGQVIDLMAALKASLAKEKEEQQRATPKPDKRGSSVRLDSLAPGAKVRTPIDDEGLGGTEATLIRVGTGSATVRLAGTRRSMQVREPGMEQESKTVEFDAPGRLVSWALSTEVIPL